MKVKLISYCIFILLSISTSVIAQITLTKPNGGEIWRSGSQDTIKWTNSVGNVTIEYSTNNGVSWSSVGNSGSSSFLWTIPNVSTPFALIKITDETPSFDSSNDVFRIINPNITSSPVKILPVGNSITFDSFRKEFRFTQDKISYRGILWDSLRSNNYNFDFIGHRLGGYYEFPDAENNGIPAITDDQVDYLLRNGKDKVNDIQVTPGNYLSVYTPDIVLLHIGINGITGYNGTSSVDVENILQWIKEYNPNIWVIVALIIDQFPNISQVTTFNNNVSNMVNARIDQGDNLLLVDMQSALNYNIDTTFAFTDGDMYDDTHPNDAGKLKMANVWFPALELILSNTSAQAPTSFTSTPKLDAYLGLPYKYNADANGIGAPNYSLEGTVPAGMTINSKTGIIDWNPTALGNFSVDIKAENSSGFTNQNFVVTVTQPPSIINNMVSYWQFEDSGSPAAFEDLPGINDAIPIDTPSIVTGIVGNALDFDGSNKLDVLDDSSLYFRPGEGLSIEMWLKSNQTGPQIFLGKRGGGYSYYYLGTNSLNQIYFEIRDSLDHIKSKTGSALKVLNDGNWHHIAGVIDRAIYPPLNKNRQRVYVDGIGASDEETFDLSGFFNYDPLTIGYYKNTFFYDGLLDEVAIYNRRVLGTEIARHYISGLARKGYTDNYVLVKAKALLQGPYIAATGKMDTSLNYNNYIPTSVHPYTGAPWNYNGMERLVSVPDSVVDWVLVELRDATNPAVVVAKRAALLRNDGSIIDILPYTILGPSDVIFTGVSPGNYYIAIKHRNHLAIMSRLTVALSNSASLYDFTDSQTKASTTGPDPMADLGGGKFGMFAGDANADGSPDAFDDNLYWRPANGQPYSYSNGADYDLDGGVDAFDSNLFWRPNNGKSTQVP